MAVAIALLRRDEGAESQSELMRRLTKFLVCAPFYACISPRPSAVARMSWRVALVLVV